MAIFSVSASREDIIEMIEAFAQQEGFQNVWTSKSHEYLCEIGGSLKGSLGSSAVKWSLKKALNNTVINLEVDPLYSVKWLYVSLWAAMIVWAGTGLLSLALASSSELGLYILGVAAILGTTVAAYRYGLTKELRVVQARFCEKLNKLWKVDIVKPVSSNILPVRWELAQNLSVAALMAVAAVYLFPLMGVLALVFGSPLVLLAWLQQGVKQEPYAEWKMVLCEFLFRWQIFIAMPLVLFLLFYYLHVAFFAQQSINEPSEYWPSVTMAVRTLYLKSAFEEDYSDPTVANLVLARNAALRKTAVAIKELPVLKPHHRSIYRDSLASQLYCLHVLSLVFGLVFIVVASYLFYIAREWEETVATKAPKLILPPAVFNKEKHGLTVTQIFIIPYSIIATILNFLLAFLATETIHFLFFGKALFWSPISRIVAWIRVPPLLRSEITGVRPSWLYNAIWEGFLWIIAFLVSSGLLIALFRWFVGVIKMLLNRIKKEHESVPEYIRKMCSQICSDLGVYKARVEIVGSREVGIWTHKPFWKRVSVVKLTTRALECLSVRELRSIIAHEAAHIRQDLRRVEATKFLCKVALFPNYFLAVALDFARRELEADRIALGITKDPEGLRNALLKTSVINSFTEESGPRWLSLAKKIEAKPKLRWVARIMRRIHVLHEFLLGDTLIGYSHPYIGLRIAQIDVLARSDRNKSGRIE